MQVTEIHPTALVSPEAKLGENVKIGAFSIIEDDVEIGDNTVVRSSVVIANGSRIGKDCLICHGAVIGTEPQDLKYANERTYAKIGDRNTIREYATINRGTTATYETRVGSDCLIMTYCHIAHDCHIGNNIVMSNVTQLGGHVTMEDWVITGGVVKIHQFCTVGKHTMIGADVKIVKDVPPYTLIGRVPPQVEGVNKIGLRRRGFSPELVQEIINFYDVVLFSGLNTTDGINKYRSREVILPEIEETIKFIENSTRGIYR